MSVSNVLTDDERTSKIADVVHVLRNQYRPNISLSACLEYLAEGKNWEEIAAEMRCTIDEVDRAFHSISVRAHIDQLPREQREELIRIAHQHLARGIALPARSTLSGLPNGSNATEAPPSRRERSHTRAKHEPNEEGAPRALSANEIESLARKVAAVIPRLWPKQKVAFELMLQGLTGQALADKAGYKSAAAARAMASSVRGALGLTKIFPAKNGPGQSLLVMRRAMEIYGSRRSSRQSSQSPDQRPGNPL